MHCIFVRLMTFRMVMRGHREDLHADILCPKFHTRKRFFCSVILPAGEYFTVKALGRAVLFLLAYHFVPIYRTGYILHLQRSLCGVRRRLIVQHIPERAVSGGRSY